MELTIARKLFETFEKNNLRYCHWKSNQHLQEALNGCTDLDVLVDKEQARKCEKLLKQLAFVKLLPVSISYPDIEDWLGFDKETGKLVHLHLHYSLIVGEKNLKSIHLPIEKWLLDNSISYEGIRIPAYECELMLLIIRSVIKIDIYDILKATIKRRSVLLPGGVNNELDWLLERWDKHRFEFIIGKSGIPLEAKDYFEFIDNYKSRQLSVGYMMKTKLYFLKKLWPYTRFSGSKYLLKKAIVFFQNLPGFRSFKRKQKKVLANQRLYFSLVGADGSGKTTVAKDLEKWFGWKLKVEPIYFGIPKSDFAYSILRKTTKGFNLVNKAFKKISIKLLSSIVQHLRDLIAALAWVYLANRRLKLSKKARKLSDKGIVVIAERFPLKHFWQMNSPMDGPKIRTNNNRVIGKLADIEQNFYEDIGLPGLVFVLKVDIEELRRRKNNMSFDLQSEKAYFVNSIQNNEKYCSIDANMPYEEVLLILKKELWRSLNKAY